MILDLKDFRRIFAFASCCLAIFNLWAISVRSTLDLTVCMFLVSNILAVNSFQLKTEFQNKYSVFFCKVLGYVMVSSVFFALFDTSMVLIALGSLRIIHTIIVTLSGLYCLILTFVTVSNAEITAAIEDSVHDLTKSFSNITDDFVDNIDEMGGWSEFLKTEVGQNFAKTVKDASKTKTPRDHKRRKRR